MSDWGKEFDAEEVFKNEESTVIAGLPSLAEGNFSELPSSAPPLMDVDGMEVGGEGKDAMSGLVIQILSVLSLG